MIAMKTLQKPKGISRRPSPAKSVKSITLPSPKETVLELVRQQPDDATWSDLMYRLYARERIERGLQQIASGETEDGESVFEELLRDG